MANQDVHKILQSIAIAAAMTALLWVLHVIVWAAGIETYYLGIIPRQTEGMIGIFTGPLLHASFSHLIANTSPLFFFTIAIMYFYRPVAFRAAGWIYLMTSVWVWVAAHDGSHIGASGMVYGLGAFLFFSGVFRRDTRSMVLALVIAFFYGGMVWGVLPVEPGVSWESHLFGAVAGTAVAFQYRKVAPAERKRYSWEYEPEQEHLDRTATWNYRENWQGADQIYIPEIRPEDQD